MKMKYSLSTLLLAIGSLFALGRNREEVCNVASSVGTHDNAAVDRSWEPATAATRFVLVQTGTAPATQVIVNVATTRPLGVVYDEPAQNETTNVRLLGIAPGTIKMIANAAVTAGAPVYTEAAGKVSATYGATKFLVGRALTAAAADGDLIEVMHCFPLINAAATL